MDMPTALLQPMTIFVLSVARRLPQAGDLPSSSSNPILSWNIPQNPSLSLFVSLLPAIKITRPTLSQMLKSRSHRPFAISTNSQGKRNASPGPPSPTFSETTNVSAVNLGENGPAKVITRSDLKASMQSYENVSLPSSRVSSSPSFLFSLRSRNKQKRSSHPFSPFSILHERTHDTTASIALKFMCQLPIRPTHNVPSHRRVRRRNGNLRRVCSTLFVSRPLWK